MKNVKAMNEVKKLMFDLDQTSATLQKLSLTIKYES